MATLPSLRLQMTTPKGERWWYSPVLHRASLGVPAMPCGGFCAEEMGLGKARELSLCAVHAVGALMELWKSDAPLQAAVDS